MKLGPLLEEILATPLSQCGPQSMNWIELKRSSPVQIHEPLTLIQSNPAEDQKLNPVQSNPDTTE